MDPRCPVRRNPNVLRAPHRRAGRAPPPAPVRGGDPRRNEDRGHLPHPRLPAEQVGHPLRLRRRIRAEAIRRAARCRGPETDAVRARIPAAGRHCRRGPGALCAHRRERLLRGLRQGNIREGNRGPGFLFGRRRRWTGRFLGPAQTGQIRRHEGGSTTCRQTEHSLRHDRPGRRRGEPQCKAVLRWSGPRSSPRRPLQGLFPQ
mmetsp:Transcript_18406/g.42488  ORF Transcript_18406/g.42488 Transcript_18406/m.42488 type:complete len:203 (-) Transcript_18406:554-1162(-)